jgi:tRNA threonylcarbamoyl adenosine modification protein YeaZ
VSAVEGTGASRWRLVLDTATHTSTVALGDGADLVAASQRDSHQRHATIVLEQIQEVLDRAGIKPAALRAIGVGTGPGSFTGLRVGIATAKTLAWSLDVPIVGISTTDALTRALDVPGSAIVLPAGAHDVFLASPGSEPRLVPLDGLAGALNGHSPVAVDLDPDRLPANLAVRGGANAVDGLPVALLSMLDERLAASDVDDASALVPGYVALPRGITVATGEVAWSPDLR